MRYFLGILAIALLILGCSDTTSPKEKPSEFRLEILVNGTVKDTIIVTEDNCGTYPIFINDEKVGETETTYHEINYDPSTDEISKFFRIKSRKDNHFTMLNKKYLNDTLRIDYIQDFASINPELNCGTMIDPSEGYIENGAFSVWQDSVFVDSLFTDEMGRFETTIEPGNYTLKSSIDECQEFVEEFNLIENYSDYFYSYYMVNHKPNIYIYPEKTINLDVNISFPKTGKVIVSIPQFPGEWQNIEVQPNGKIDGEYNYLFYESYQPNVFQRTTGWVVENKNLSSFFTKNLQETGFNKNEIDDFIEHWIPRLKDSEFYAIYPQYNKELDSLIKLEFSKTPDRILRLTYLVKKLESKDLNLDKPEIPAFERKGFYITEWGLMYDEDEKNIEIK